MERHVLLVTFGYIYVHFDTFGYICTFGDMYTIDILVINE